MDVSGIFKTIVRKVRYNMIVEWCNFMWVLFRMRNEVSPSVASIDETIAKIVKDKCSISRFGDGEVLLILPEKNLGFQHGSYEISEKLKEVLTSDEPGMLICIADTFSDLKRYNRSTRRFWTCHFYLYDYLWASYLSAKRKYYNAFVSRLYTEYNDKSKCEEWFRNIKQIWDGRDVIFIEGEKSRLGMGNDLFNNAHSIKRILGPVRDGFDRSDDLLDLAKKYGEKDTLFLLALGPAATCLAYDLHKLGYQAVDIGHIDIEYEWWRMKAIRKVKIANKFVNEAAGGDAVGDAKDALYKSQIVANINDILFKKKRTVVYCTPALYCAGGIERAVTEKCNYFAENLGYDMYVILTDGAGKKPYYPVSEKVHIIQLDLKFEQLWNANIIMKVWLYATKQLRYIQSMRKALDIIKPDITVTCMRREVNFLYKMRDGSKKIAELHINRTNLRRFETSPYDSGISYIYRLLPKIWKKNIETTLSRYSKFITLSNEDAKNWAGLDNLEVIPDPIENLPELSCKMRSKRVIAVGRYVPQKGFDTLLNIWKNIEERFPEWELCIYGPGEIDFYKKAAEKLELKRAHLYGALTANEVFEKFKEASIHVLPSRYEGFGMVIIEAMSCGLPCVSFDCPSGPSDIIHDGKDGILVKNGDEKEFAEKLSKLMSDEKLVAEMGMSARKNAEQYTMENISKRWISLFDEVLMTDKNK